MLKEYLSAFEEGLIRDTQYFTHHKEETIMQKAIEITHSPYEISDNWHKMHEIAITDKRFIYHRDFQSALCRFKLRKVQDMMRAVESDLKVATDEDQIMALMYKKQQLNTAEQELCEKIGTVVVVR